jgi:drug/metabolite transporter (DMT)-like permease
MSAFLYISVIFLWGFTWFAIKNQLGIVPIEISLIYRFLFAAIILFFIMIIKREAFRFSLKQHSAMALLGSLLFSVNFIFLYSATAYIESGLMAIIFSTSVIMIMLNSMIFFKKPISTRMITGGIFGLIGLGCIFWLELEGFSFTGSTCFGLILALIGTYCFAWATQVSTYCLRLSIPLISSTFYGMVYGVILLTIYCFIMKIPFKFDPSLRYVAFLAYLVIPGSVLGFMSYLALVKKIGPEKAVYTTLFFPIVALLVSTYFESFKWMIGDYAGVAMILLGNALVLTKPISLKRLAFTKP